jgi:putative ATP-binding cassette transporter
MKSRTQSSSARGDAPSNAVDASALCQLLSLLRVLGASRHRRRVGLLAVGIVLVIGANMLGQIRLNVWQGAFYDALEQKNLDAFVSQLFVFLFIVAGLLTLVVTETWLREMLEVRLREWLTHDLIDEWLIPKRAYFLAFAGDVAVNRDQRMQADCQRLTEF